MRCFFDALRNSGMDGAGKLLSVDVSLAGGTAARFRNRSGLSRARRRWPDLGMALPWLARIDVAFERYEINDRDDRVL